MKLSEALQKKLSMVYEPSSLLNMRFKGNDVSFKTDEAGNPVLLFIGERRQDGSIKGERYSRVLKRDAAGHVFKDHWEMKGKAS